MSRLLLHPLRSTIVFAVDTFQPCERHVWWKRLIFFSIGPPGRLAEWCDGVLARLAGRLEGGVCAVTWPPLAWMLRCEAILPVLDQVALCLITANVAHLVMGARQPDGRLRAMFEATNVRFVVALDDPRHAVAEFLADSDAELTMVTRAIANCCALAMWCTSLPGAVTIRGDQARSDAVLAVDRMARLFDLTLDAGEAQSIADGLSPCLASPSTSSEEWSVRIPDSGRNMVEGALGAYARCFAGDELTQILWTRELFFVNGDSGAGLADVLELAGGARLLIYGPYIQLPPGSWTARVVLGFSAEAARHTFLVDACAGSQLACTSFQPVGAGVYSADINFSLDEPNEHGLEIRVWVASENARGQLAFGHVVLRPLAMRQPDFAAASQNDFRAVLDL